MPQISPHEQQIAPDDISIQDRYLEAVKLHEDMVGRGQTSFDEGALRPSVELFKIEASNLTPDMELIDKMAGSLADDIEGKEAEGPQEPGSQLERLRNLFVGEKHTSVDINFRAAKLAYLGALRFKVTLDEQPGILGKSEKYIGEKVDQIEFMNKKRQQETIGGTALAGSDSLDIHFERETKSPNQPKQRERPTPGPEIPSELPNPPEAPSKGDDPGFPTVNQ